MIIFCWCSMLAVLLKHDDDDDDDDDYDDSDHDNDDADVDVDDVGFDDVDVHNDSEQHDGGGFGDCYVDDIELDIRSNPAIGRSGIGFRSLTVWGSQWLLRPVAFQRYALTRLSRSNDWSTHMLFLLNKNHTLQYLKLTK